MSSMLSRRQHAMYTTRYLDILRFDCLTTTGDLNPIVLFKFNFLFFLSKLLPTYLYFNDIGNKYPWLTIYLLSNPNKMSISKATTTFVRPNIYHSPLLIEYPINSKPCSDITHTYFDLKADDCVSISNF